MSASRPAATGQRPRQEWMDAVRGIAVLLVVVFHVSPLIRTVGFSSGGWMAEFNEFFAPVRIPTLVFLSGVLLGISLDKSTYQYLDGKARRILWPYLVWSLVWAVVSWPGVIEHRSFFLGGSYLWFLCFILVYYVWALALARVPALVVAAASFAVSLAAPDGSKYGERVFFLFALFMLGHACAKADVLSQRWLQSRLVGVVAAGGVVAGYVLDVGPFAPATLPVTACGVVAFIVFARRAVRLARWSGVVFLGRNSLVYYVSHFPVMALVVLPFAGVDVARAVVWGTGIASALLVGTGLALLSQRVPISWLFVAPLHLPRRASAEASEVGAPAIDVRDFPGGRSSASVENRGESLAHQ